MLTKITNVTFIMYHYVRNCNDNRFPKINALDISEFDSQLEHIRNNYTVIGLSQAMDGLFEHTPLPSKPCVLTFDDGLLDHYLNVFPRLRERGWSGAFFPIAETTLNPTVADVHKIHFILALADDDRALFHRTCELLPELRKYADFEGDQNLIEKWAHPNRFDTAEVIFVKRLMQTAIPEAARRVLVDRLFAEMVPDEEGVLSTETYLKPEHIKEMVRSGMEIGGHGYRHLWLGRLDEASLEKEVQGTAGFLGSISGKSKGWVMCYPSGSYNDQVINSLKCHGFSGGLSTEVRVATSKDNRFAIPRMDTKDVPLSRDPQRSIL